jgi:hypothetical protein
MICEGIIDQSGGLDSGFGKIRGREHVLARSKLLKVMSRRLVGVQIGRGASKDCLTVVLPNVEGIVNSRVESDIICSVNHLGEAKDVGDMIGIIVNFAKGWDLSFEGQSSSASVSVHGYGSLGWANVANKVWITDCPVNARARV